MAENNLDPSFIKGKPENLELMLAEYSPKKQTNISVEDLRSSITGYTSRRTSVVLKDKDNQPMGDGVVITTYFYFPKKENSIEIQLNEGTNLYLALQPENYGFPQERTVRIAPMAVKLELSKRARDVYSKILSLNCLEINDLLESVGFIINSSMEFDFKMAEDAVRKTEIGVLNYLGKDYFEKSIKERFDYMKSGGYIPTGEEIMKGFCQTSGNLIRQILDQLGLEESIKFLGHNSDNGITSHDTTLVFDKYSGHWAVINSKSATKFYNLAPKDKLVELGSPYV